MAGSVNYCNEAAITKYFRVDKNIKIFILKSRNVLLTVLEAKISKVKTLSRRSSTLRGRSAVS
jgi:hypothetical protein